MKPFGLCNTIFMCKKNKVGGYPAATEACVDSAAYTPSGFLGTQTVTELCTAQQHRNVV